MFWQVGGRLSILGILVYLYLEDELPGIVSG